MGVVLILITLLLKLITYPMVKKSYMSSAKMRVLKPKLEAATAQFNKPEDQMQKQQAMMAEYAKYGVSPLSGCLPMLIQMPVWVAMFNFVPNAIQLRGEVLVDERLEHLRPNLRVEHQHLVDWRPLEFDLYSLLRSQPVVLMDDDAPAA